MRIIFYGRLASELGRELQIAVEEPCTIDALRERIVTAFPSAAVSLRDKRVRACVGDEIVANDHRVAPAEEVAFLAPVSGG